MKKLLPIIIIGVVFLGVGAYFLSQNSSQNTVNQSQQQTEQQGSQETGVADTGDQKNYSGTLKKMADLGVPLKCTYSQENGASGTTWIKGKNFYSEIETQGQSGTVIFKDDCLWNWSENQEKGVKMCFEPEQVKNMFEGEAEVGQTSLPNDVNFNCRPAVFTDAKFNPPEDVEFMDMEQMMQGMQE